MRALAPLLVAGLLAGSAACSCGSVDAFFLAAYDVRLKGTESCGPDFSSFMGDLRNAGGDAAYNFTLRPTAVDGKMQADLDAMHADVFLGRSPSLAAGSTFSVDDGTLWGDAYWVDMAVDGADLASGSFTVESVGEPDDYGDIEVDATWDLTFGEPGSGGNWLVASGADTIRVNHSVW
jgi:hypothetical protein